MADSPPTSAAGREVRNRPKKPTGTRSGTVRTPLLAGLGAGDLALRRLAELSAGVRERLASDELRKRLDQVRGRARVTYTELAERGEETLRRRGIGKRWLGEATPAENSKAPAEKPQAVPAEKPKAAPAASAKRPASARAARTSAARTKSAPTSAGSTGKTSPGGRRDR